MNLVSSSSSSSLRVESGVVWQRARRAALSLLLALSTVAGCRDGARSAQGPTVTVMVREPQGKPLRGVHLRLRATWPSNTPFTEQALSDSQGRSEFHPPPGDYVIEASRPGSAPAFSMLSDLGSLPRLVRCTLYPGATMSGRVRRRSDGAPVPFATVQAVPASTAGAQRSFRVVSERDGTFKAVDLEPGAFWVSASAPGLSTRQALFDRLEPGEQLGNVELWVEPGYAISGHVTRGSSSPGGAPLRIVASALSEQSGSVAGNVDSVGNYRIDGLAPGSYRLSAWAGHVISTLGGAEIVVNDADSSGHELIVEAGHSLVGTLRPGLRAQVRLRRVGACCGGDMGTTQFSTRSDEGGAFRFDDMPRGRFLLSALTADGLQAQATIDIGEQPLAPLALALEHTLRVTGRVTDEQGHSLAEAWLSFVPRREPNSTLAVANREQRVRTNDEGAFELFVPKPGEYDVTLNGRFGERAWAETSRFELPSTKRVTLGDSERALVLRAASCGGSLRGTVRDRQQQPVPYAELILASDRAVAPQMIDADPEQQRAQSGADGRFEISGLCKGSYRIKARTASGQFSATRAGLAENSESDLILQPTSVLKGSVKRALLPVNEYELELGGPTTLTRRVHSRDGEFSLPELEPGQYEVMVRDGEGYALDQVLVEPGTVVPHDFTMHAWSALRGQLGGAFRSPKTPIVAEAIFEPDGGDGADLLGPSLRVRRTSVNAQGEFTLSKLIAGRGYLAFWMAGRRLFVTDQDFRLKTGVLHGASPWLNFALPEAEQVNLGAIAIRP